MEQNDRAVRICKRSFNYLLSLVLGLHIVSNDWLEQSIREGEWLETETYEIFSDDQVYLQWCSAEEEAHRLGICRRSRIFYRSNVLLSPLFGYSFHLLLSENNDDDHFFGHLTSDQMKTLINVWGGEIIHKLDVFFKYCSTRQDKCVILVQSHGPYTMSCNPFTFVAKESRFSRENGLHLEERSNAQVVDFTWISDSVASCKLLPIDQYLYGHFVAY